MAKLTSYHSIPNEPLDKYGHWPEAIAHGNTDRCAVCGAQYTTYRTSKLEVNGSYDMTIPSHRIPPHPHLNYACGGGWRQVYDHWEGFCGVPKTRQLEIEFTV
jgi:hypothetical protein